MHVILVLLTYIFDISRVPYPHNYTFDKISRVKLVLRKKQMYINKLAMTQIDISFVLMYISYLSNVVFRSHYRTNVCRLRSVIISLFFLTYTGVLAKQTITFLQFSTIIKELIS